jgi:P pilus assembly chaperone PapD
MFFATRLRLAISALSLIAALSLVVASPAPAQAQAAGGDINISPKRVVFDAAGHGATVYVFNRGTAPATYSISVVDRVMTPQGEILAVDEAKKDPAKAALAGTVKSAKDFIVFTPRRVTLKPNESQTIRLRALKPNDLAAGEYRTHLTVTEVPPEDIGLTAEEAAKVGPKELSIRIVPIFSLSIPLIVRQGDADVHAAIEAPHMVSERIGAGDERRSAIGVTLVRLGTSSVYGNLEIRNGDDVLGSVRGVAVYPEIQKRLVSIPLTKMPKSGQSLTIAFVDDDTQSGTELAKINFAAP